VRKRKKQCLFAMSREIAEHMQPPLRFGLTA